MRCADRAIAWAIQNGDNTGENAGSLAAVICRDQLDQLRALLAREVGLAEAGRFYRRSDHDLRETAKDYWRWAHPASPPPSTKAAR